MAVKICISAAVFALLLTNIHSLEFKDCGSKIGKFENVKVSDCDETKVACVLRRQTNATIDLDLSLFEVDSVEEVNTVVHGIIMGVEMPFPLPNPNACVGSGLTCPLQKDTVYKYQASLPVLKSYPKVKVTVKWELKSAKDEVIMCVLIPAKIE